MPANIEKILNSDSNSVGGGVSIDSPLRGMSQALARNVIHFLGADSKFIETSKNLDDMMSAYKHLRELDISNQRYFDFFIENQFHVINFLSKKSKGINGHSRSVSKYIELRCNKMERKCEGNALGFSNRSSANFYNTDLVEALYKPRSKVSGTNAKYFMFIYLECLNHVNRSYNLYRSGVSHSDLVKVFFEKLKHTDEISKIINGDIADAILSALGGVEGFISAADDAEDGFALERMIAVDRYAFYINNEEAIKKVFENTLNQSKSKSIVNAVSEVIFNDDIPIDHIAVGIYEPLTSYGGGSSGKNAFIAAFIDYLLETTIKLFHELLDNSKKEGATHA